MERTGAKTALLITEGFRDIYEIGRINRPDAYNLFFEKHEPLIERALRFEVRERLRADGEIDIPLDEARFAAARASGAKLGVEAGRHSVSSATATARTRQRAKELIVPSSPAPSSRASHELSQEYREFDAIDRRRQRLYRSARAALSRGSAITSGQGGFRGSFLLVQSTGGLYEVGRRKSHCIRMLESGPAAGVIGTQALCAALGLADAIAFDMGGTTAKAGVIYHGEPLTTGGRADRRLCNGAADADSDDRHFRGRHRRRHHRAGRPDGALRVGPQSAGATPGPACYGLGGDANRP